jgi:lysophospholipase L1-like esterase
MLMIKCLRLSFVVAGILIATLSTAQDTLPKFYNEIQEFKKQDSINPPPKNAIVFIGSSSFRMWKNLQEMFPGYPIINRGFGGSSLPDVQRYVDDIVFRYQPKQVVIYAGENDLPGDSVDSRIVTDRFKKLFNTIRQRLPGVPIVYISMKPSPSREKYLATMRQANQMINNFLWQQRNVGYVDVYSKMIDASGNPNPQLFLEDKLHMNQNGYLIWQEALRPYLIKN